MSDLLMPILAGAIVLAGYLGWRLLRRGDHRRKAGKARAFRESVRGVAKRGDGLDLSLQHQSRPFRTRVWLNMQYLNGSFVDTNEPDGETKVYLNV